MTLAHSINLATPVAATILCTGTSRAESGIKATFKSHFWAEHKKEFQIIICPKSDADATLEIIAMLFPNE